MSDVKGRGRRCSRRDKSFALTIRKSPKIYKLLRKVFFLPSVTTLRPSLKGFKLNPGFNKNLFKALQLKTCQMSATDKLCVILFDEMSIKESLSYDIAEDSVVGVEDFGGGHKSSCVANHVGVFMLKGLVSSWKQPLGYFLTSGPMKAPLLRTLLLDAVDRLQSIGMLVNQDSLENLFSVIRGKGEHRDNPDSVQFKAAFTETTIDSIFITSKQANCEEGMDSFLMTLIEADAHDPLFQIPTPPVIPPLILELKALNQPHHSLDLIEENIVVYIAGYIAKRIQKLVCNACFSRFTGPMNT